MMTMSTKSIHSKNVDSISINQTNRFSNRQWSIVFNEPYLGALQRLMFALMRVTISSSQNRNEFLFDLRVPQVAARDKTNSKIFGPDELADVLAGAQSDINAFNGDIGSDTVPNRSNFEPEWDEILCTLPGTKKLTTTLGGYQTEVEFDTHSCALSPAAEPKRYEDEIRRSALLRK